ncbi:hypothetical protein [Stappia sp. WLB 29]|uniref:hypothetical protein n=1 Tax=Stappia sp. WLB 29 TaxID=2925220 RepID=UPI0020C0925F|nr:hypothetical protein [Stappia sp. WLB 29]
MVQGIVLPRFKPLTRILTALLIGLCILNFVIKLCGIQILKTPHSTGSRGFGDETWNLWVEYTLFKLVLVAVALLMWMTAMLREMWRVVAQGWPAWRLSFQTVYLIPFSAIIAAMPVPVATSSPAAKFIVFALGQMFVLLGALSLAGQLMLEPAKMDTMLRRTKARFPS